MTNKFRSNLYSASFHPVRKVWIAQVKAKDGTWSTKFIPREYGRTDAAGAERWLISWISSGGEQKKKPLVLVPRSILFFAQKWLNYRDQDKFTSPNTFNGFKLSMNNWILDNERFEHHSIQDLDVLSELSVREILEWIHSLTGANSSKLQHIGTLRTFFNDLIMLEWDKEIAEMSNPLEKPAVKKLVRALEKERRETNIITWLNPTQLETLFTEEHQFISDGRRTLYATMALTGLRLEEAQGLTWEDVDLIQAVVHVERQLIKAGCAPILSYPELRAKKSKSQIAALPNAVGKPPKRNSKRDIPLHPLLVKLLSHWRHSGWKDSVGRSPDPQDPVFPRSSRSLKPGETAGHFRIALQSAELFQKDLERLGIPVIFGRTDKKLVIHSLRHTFSHLCELAGAEDKKIEVLLGHGGGSTLRKNYLNPQLEVQRKIILQMPVPNRVQLRNVKL